MAEQRRTIESPAHDNYSAPVRFRLKVITSETFHGIPPTGKPVTTLCIDFSRLSGGRIIELYRVFDVCDYLRQQAAHGLTAAVLCPIGFLCDHIEVLYDLDVEAASACRDIGLPGVRAKAVNDHPRFVDALADAVIETVDRYRRARPLRTVNRPS